MSSVAQELLELEIRDLQVEVEGKKILSGVDLRIPQGEVHALMGPNGAGKTSLGYAVMGHPKYQITGGEINWKGQSLLGMLPEARARMGLFLSLQYPTAVPGVTTVNFLRAALKGQGKEMPAREFLRLVREQVQILKMDQSFMSRYINDNFSGGEKKRMEIVQMAVLRPEMAILDETDSGLDVDALRTVAEGVNRIRSEGMGVLIITHYQRILDYIEPDRVHIMAAGRIIKSGAGDLVKQIETTGYDPLLLEAGIEIETGKVSDTPNR